MKRVAVDVGEGHFAEFMDGRSQAQLSGESRLVVSSTAEIGRTFTAKAAFLYQSVGMRV